MIFLSTKDENAINTLKTISQEERDEVLRAQSALEKEMVQLEKHACYYRYYCYCWYCLVFLPLLLLFCSRTKSLVLFKVSIPRSSYKRYYYYTILVLIVPSAVVTQ